MNGQTMKWLLGILVTIIVLSMGAHFTLVVSRLDKIEANVEEVQQEYYQIGELRTQGLRQDRQLEELRALAEQQQGQIADMQYKLNGVIWLLTREGSAQKRRTPDTPSFPVRATLP